MLLLCHLRVHLVATETPMANQPQLSIRPDDRLLTVKEYCERFKRSRASYYRDRAAGRVCVIMTGGSPRIVERTTLERLAGAADDEAA